MSRLFLAFFGLLLVVVGTIGIVMPILPGWPLIFIGLSFIAPRLVERWKIKVYARYFKKPIVLYEEWLHKKIYAGMSTKSCQFKISRCEDFSNQENQISFKKFMAEDGVLKKHKAPPILRYVSMRQVHADHIAVINEKMSFNENGFAEIQNCDALITKLPQTVLLALSADCLPIYMRAGKWIGIVHAGWKGTEAKIAQKAYHKLREHAGTRRVHVIFGPCIRRKNYEVGAEFAPRFKNSVFKKKGKFYFDLAGENKRQLFGIGMRPDMFFDVEACTIADNDVFYSFRKEKDAALRMISFIFKGTAA